MKYSVLLPILILWWWSFPAFGAEPYHVDMASENSTEFSITEQSDTGLVLTSTIDGLDLEITPSSMGDFLQPAITGFSDGPWENGAPQLPVRSIMIEIPQNATIRVQVTDVEETRVNLDELFPGLKIFPTQPPRSKAIDADNSLFYYDEALYAQNQIITPERISVDIRGTLRSMRLTRLTLCPFRYNPVTNDLWITHSMTVNVYFDSADILRTRLVKQRFQTATFEAPLSDVAGKLPLASQTKAPTTTTASNSPMTYVVVASESFLSNTALQDLITWKKRSGFHVIEADTDSIFPETLISGIKKYALKNYLESLYNESDTPPSYILFVGDTTLIPSYEISGTVINGDTLKTHYTDLYYCEYTGDSLPDVYYGRFPVGTDSELTHVATKTLRYETCDMPSLTHLGKSVLIAGADLYESATYANGQVTYLLNEYINTANGFSDITAFFFDDPDRVYYDIENREWENTHVKFTGDAIATSNLLDALSPGAGFVNYTGHCDEYGWFNGVAYNYELTSFDIDDEFLATNQLGFYVSNCCESSRIEMNVPASFGAEVLLAGQKGAAAYLGAANETFWDTDFAWAVGYRSLILQRDVLGLSYGMTGRGNFDALWHTHGEPQTEWFTTAGQIVYAGNLAVETMPTSANFDMGKYYWEIYNVMGDPSLSPYMGEPALIPEPDAIVIVPCQDSSVNIQTQAYARVTLSKDQELLGTTLADENGLATIHFSPLNNQSDLDLVITKQNHQPLEVFFQSEAVPDETLLDSLPQASFYAGTDPAALTIQVIANKAVTFTNTSTGCPTLFSWNFVDGADIFSSADQNPTVTYSNLGTFSVTLTVTNGIGSSEVFQKDVQVSPAVNFETNVQSLIPGTPITFIPQCSHEPSAWSWTFPGADPETSSDESPKVVFPAKGIYTASLSITIDGETFPLWGPTVKSIQVEKLPKEQTGNHNAMDFSDGIIRGGSSGGCFIGSMP